MRQFLHSQDFNYTSVPLYDTMLCTEWEAVVSFWVIGGDHCTVIVFEYAKSSCSDKVCHPLRKKNTSIAWFQHVSYVLYKLSEIGLWNVYMLQQGSAVVTHASYWSQLYLGRLFKAIVAWFSLPWTFMRSKHNCLLVLYFILCFKPALVHSFLYCNRFKHRSLYHSPVGSYPDLTRHLTAC